MALGAAGLEGLIHYVLIFEFDVLMFYALVSVLVAHLVGRSDKVIRGWMIGQAVLLTTIIGLLTWALFASKAGDPIGGPPADTSDWLAQVQARLDFAVVYRTEALFALPLSTVLFLAGARLLRAGALEDSERGKRIQRRLAAWGSGSASRSTRSPVSPGPSGSWWTGTCAHRSSPSACWASSPWWSTGCATRRAWCGAASPRSGGPR